MLKIKQGYSMLEMIICICILASLSIFVISSNYNIDFEGHYFLNRYLLLQSESFTEKTEQKVDDVTYFNHMGHVNQALTKRFNNHKVIIHLGNGYATLE